MESENNCNVKDFTKQVWDTDSENSLVYRMLLLKDLTRDYFQLLG